LRSTAIAVEQLARRQGLGADRPVRAVS
jgi:hypothetical protein